MLYVQQALITNDWSIRFVFKQKTAYEWRISDWCSDVCSSDLAADVADAAARAERVFAAFSESAPEARALFLEAIAEEIVAIGDALIERAMLESGLPRARLECERGRTAGQLRL